MGISENKSKIAVLLILLSIFFACSKNSPLSPTVDTESTVKRAYYNTNGLMPGTPIDYALMLDDSMQIHFCFKEKDPADTFVYLAIVDTDTAEGTFINDFDNDTTSYFLQGKSIYSFKTKNCTPIKELKVFLRRYNEGSGTIGYLAE
jgi:hypothetical protein